MAKMILTLLIVIALISLPKSKAITEDEIQKFIDVGTPVTDRGTYYLIGSDGIPDHDHGDFPNDDNPYSIEEQDHRFHLYKVPTPTEPTCLPLGSIAVTLNGVPLFNPYTIEGEDANVVEVFDDCQGHPSPLGEYHYHQNPQCIYTGGNNELVASALDGYPIYGPKDEFGNTLTSKDLDDCHGRYKDGQYRYHITADFPYIMGCFKADVSDEVKHRQETSRCDIINSTSSRSIGSSNTVDALFSHTKMHFTLGIVILFVKLVL